MHTRDRQGLGWLLWIWCAMAMVAACEAGSSGHRVLSTPLSPLEDSAPAAPAPICPPCDCPTPPSPGTSAATESKPRPAPNPQPTKINLNDATVDALMSLPGVGRVTAEKIINYRAKRRFRSTRELMRVRGIGRSRWRKLKDRVEVTP